LAGHHPKVHRPGGILRCGPGHEGAAGPACRARQLKRPVGSWWAFGGGEGGGPDPVHAVLRSVRRSAAAASRCRATAAVRRARWDSSWGSCRAARRRQDRPARRQGADRWRWRWRARTRSGPGPAGLGGLSSLPEVLHVTLGHKPGCRRASHGCATMPKVGWSAGSASCAKPAFTPGVLPKRRT
jgi:hypothetical protein